MFEKLTTWFNVYKRIRFFKEMYPLSAIIKDIFLLPVDYLLNNGNIGIVRNVTMAITHRCNLRCEMCYFHEKLNNTCDLSLEIYKCTIDALKKGRPCIILSGGEPFLHRNLIEMVTYAKEAGLPVQIFSNGTLIKPNLVDSLVKIGLDYIDFTLLGNENSHSKIANVSGAYKKFRENIAYFSENRGNTKIILNYTVTPKAIKDINHAVELVKIYRLDGLRIQHYNFLLPGEFKAQEEIIARLFSRESATHEIESTVYMHGISDQLIEFKKQLPINLPKVPVQWVPTLSNSEIRHWYSSKRFNTSRKCLYPWRGILIDADGKIYPCSKIYLELGDLKNTEVFNAWNCDNMHNFRTHLKKKLFP